MTASQPYSDLGADYFLERQLSDADRRRLVAQLKRMGDDVERVPRDAA